MITATARQVLTRTVPRAVLAALLLCGGLWSGSARAQVPIDSSLPGGSVDDQPDALVTSAMNSLPDAQAKWSACYKDCVKKSECTANICAHQCVGQVVQAGYASNVASQIMRYNVLGIMGASCIGDFRKYLDTALKVARSAHNLGDINHAAINLLIDKIIDQIEYQIFSQIMNSVCQVSNEILQSADSFVKSAICLPNATLNPFSFNLNLGRLQCDGWSVNALTGQVQGQPINGVPVNTNNLFTSSPGVTLPPVTGR